ncbi:MAG: nucleotidyltransferase domain-containing protein [Anaerolineae bacterium]|nr:nucleotidyltransferase domain-containing protein [Anaerolineae bacterium]
MKDTSIDLPIPVAQGQLAAYCRANQIVKLALFGSVLRDDFTDASDIDVLVEFAPEARVGLMALSRMARELTAIFDRQVDLLTPGFLSPHFREQVVENAVVIYEEER